MVAAFSLPARAQQEQIVLSLTGAADMEDLDGTEMARFDRYLWQPLRINQASRSRLLASGLLTPYQVAALLDYRATDGDILSVSELALVDGFGTETARLLTPFLSFVSLRNPGETDSGLRRTRQELTLRGAVRETGPGGTGSMDAAGSWGGRYRINRDGRWELALSGRALYDDKEKFPPSGRSAYVARYGRRYLGQFIVGSYNARFGQGLTLWNGFSMGGIASPQAAYRRPSGLSPSWSYAGTNLHGVAADFNVGRWTLSAFGALPGDGWAGDGWKVFRPEGPFLTGVNAAWFGRHGQVSSTWVREGERLHKLALDGRFCLRGVDLFAEGTRDWAAARFAFVAGAVVPAGDRSRAFLVVRSYPTGFTADRTGAVRSGSKVTDENGVALGFSRGRTTFALDGAWHPSKAEGQAKLILSDVRSLGGNWTLRSRVSERWRSRAPRNRTDVRADLVYEQGPWTAAMRLNGLFGTDFGLLGYAEAGWREGPWFLWLRGTVFRIDDWEDRIYAYERDAPGNFTVPAFYGRGIHGSCYGGWKGRRWKCWLRASVLRYPWMAEKKPGKAELKLQLSREW